MSGLKPLHCEVERGLNSDEKNDWIIFLNWIISRWRNSFNITITGQAKVNYCRIILPIVLCLKQFPNCHIPYHDHQPIWQVLVNSYKKSDVQVLTNATSDHHPIWHVLVNVRLLSVDHHVLYALHMVCPRLCRRHPVPGQIGLIFLSDFSRAAWLDWDTKEKRGWEQSIRTPILCFKNTTNRDGGGTELIGHCMQEGLRCSRHTL